jgi:hypothetical protein
MNIVEKNEKETKSPFRFIKDIFKTVKNSWVWAINQLSNLEENKVDDNTFRDIINLSFEDAYIDENEDENENEYEDENENEYEDENENEDKDIGLLQFPPSLSPRSSVVENEVDNYEI